MIELKKQGKIRHLALSNVGLKELEVALARTPIVAVQNLYNVAGGGGAVARMTHAEVEAPEGARCCAARGIAFLPFFPLGIGALRSRGARGGRGRAPSRDAGADRARVAPRAIAGHAPHPGDELARAPRGELGREDIALTQDEVSDIAAAARSS